MSNEEEASHSYSVSEQADDDDLSADLRSLLLSIEGECRALRSTSSFQPPVRESRNGMDPTTAAADPNPDLVTLLDEIERDCRSLRCIQCSSTSSTNTLLLELNSRDSGDDDGTPPSERTCSNDAPCFDNGYDGEGVGSHLALNCSLRSSAGRKRSSSRKPTRTNSLTENMEGRLVMRGVRAYGGALCNDTEMLQLIPQELRSKVTYPIEV